uniref:RRP15-like protein n=1 Tax=Plectus sambesii TaxID=2011161 RepID=A0A914X3G8_9BILA
MTVASDKVVVQEGSSSDDYESADDSGNEEHEEEAEVITFPGPEKQKKRRFDTRRKDGPSKKVINKKLVENREKDRMFMVKPDPAADREKERKLARIATQGVVQLFNAVADRQKELESKVGKAKESERRKRQAQNGLGSDDVKRKLKNEDPEMDEKSGGGWNALKEEYEPEDDEDGFDSSTVKDEPESDSD